MRTLLLVATLPLCACADGREADGAADVVVRGGAPLQAPPESADEPASSLDVFEPGIGFFPDPGDLPRESVSGLETEAPTDLPEGVAGLTWRDLSLREIYGEELRDLLFPEESGENAPTYPERVLRHDGQDVAIIGYMIPLDWSDERVPRFLLVRDLMACCFGGTPMVDEWIEVNMADEAAEYFAYAPVVVVGRLEVGAFEDDWGFAVGCYRMTAVSVEERGG